ncbi:MAG: hypothetical protein EBZ58_13570, partial [Bacteroidetes bacterium]|nr:hypothetical protein [Bacteroidota bacterium]
QKHTDLQKLLLSTGDADIYYCSTDGIIGTGNPGGKGEGRNLYGTLMKQRRQELLSDLRGAQKQTDRVTREQNMYDTYLAHKGLMSKIMDGDNLKTYINMNHSGIVDSLGRDELSKTISKQTFLATKSLRESVNTYIDYPDSMVPDIRKKMLQKLHEERLRKKKAIILEMYAEYLLVKADITDLADIETAKQQELSGPNFDQMAWNLQDSLYKLYTKRMLSERLSTSIDNKFEDYYIPSDEELKEAMSYDISTAKKVTGKESSVVSSSTQNKEFYITDPTPASELTSGNKLSPNSICNPMLVINTKAYLTVSHYIIEKLIFRLQTILIGEDKTVKVPPAHYYILDPRYIGKPLSEKSFLKPGPELFQMYEKTLKQYYRDTLVKYAKKGLDKKFDNRVMQDYLLATGNARLKYDDNKDDILGNGDNVVGEYLMELRTKFAQKRKEDKDIKALTTDDITSILSKNNFMKDWVTRRVQDYCRTLVIVNGYKLGTVQVITPKFVEAVLDTIYHPCSDIYGAVDEIKAIVPDYFI